MMKRFFSLAISLFCMTSLLSCADGSRSIEMEPNLPVDSDVTISDLSISPLSSLRSGVAAMSSVAFKDEQSGVVYHCVIAENDDGSLVLSFDNDGDTDRIHLELLGRHGDNYIVSGKYHGRDMITGVKIMTLENGDVLFELNNVEAYGGDLRAIVYESWWGCVKRIALDEDVVMATMMASPFTGGQAALAVAGAAGLVCLDKSNRLYHYEYSPAEIRPA